MQKEDSKVRLSKEEIHLLRDQDFFYSKKIITEKIVHELSETVEEIKASGIFKRISFPPGTDISTGKISKGENYLGLPYIVLDFPRLFTPEKILTFRTMVWWGNFISHAMLMSVTKDDSVYRLTRQVWLLIEKKVYFCTNESPWHHHFQLNNYVPLELVLKREIEDHLEEKKFLKVARKIPMNSINRTKEFTLASFEMFSRAILPRVK
ncbi:MAG: hypothetical protein ACHQD9_06155 [Chitinophagales bacterium]